MRSRRHDAGFALAGLICIITAAAVATAVVVPLRVMQSRRETEKELIFRGEEYIRAIQKYQRKYGIYPASIDDLISRDGYRFLRRQYKDPITGRGFSPHQRQCGWLADGLTHAALPSQFRRSRTPHQGQRLPRTLADRSGSRWRWWEVVAAVAAALEPAFSLPVVSERGRRWSSMGLGSNGGVSGISNPFSGGGTTNNNSRAGVGGGGVGTGAGIGGAFGGGGIGGITPGTLGGGNQRIRSHDQPSWRWRDHGGQRTTTPGIAPAQVAAATGPGGGPGCRRTFGAIPGTGFAAVGAAAQISPGVAGVASESTKTAVMIYNEKEKYNEWEFIAPRVQAAPLDGAGGGGGGGSRSRLVRWRRAVLAVRVAAGGAGRCRRWPAA